MWGSLFLHMSISFKPFHGNNPISSTQILGTVVGFSSDHSLLHSISKYLERVSGHEQEEIFSTPILLRCFAPQDNPYAEIAKSWKLHLYQCREFFLYCLSRTTDDPTQDPTVVIHKGNKKDNPPPQDSDSAPTSSKSGKRLAPEADKGSHFKQRRLGPSQFKGQRGPLLLTQIYSQDILVIVL